MQKQWRNYKSGQLFLINVEGVTEKASGLAFEVILKAANTDSAPAILSSSPPKERSISQEFIEKKLKDAEERRQVYYFISK